MSGREGSQVGDWMDSIQAERTLLRRMIGGLGVRVVSLHDNRQLLVSNLSMALDVDEVQTLARLIRGG